MSTKTITVLIVATLVSLASVFLILTSDSNSSKSNQKTSDLKEYAIEEIKSHDNEDDCWTVINGSVYDITTYIPRHPGGREILEACGEDATTIFTTRTDKNGDEIGSGTPHSSSAEQQLEQLRIGTLVQ